MIEQISIVLFCLFLTCLFQFSAFSQHDNCTGNCGPSNCSSLDCAESLVACSEELVGCSQKECQPLDFKAPPSKSSNSPHTDACVTPLSWPKLSTFKHREASMASAIANLEARNEKAIEVKSPHLSARASRSLWRRIVFHVSGAPLCAVQDALDLYCNTSIEWR